jgi:hypothetical protein
MIPMLAPGLHVSEDDDDALSYRTVIHSIPTKGLDVR